MSARSLSRSAGESPFSSLPAASGLARSVTTADHSFQDVKATREVGVRRLGFVGPAVQRQRETRGDSLKRVGPVDRGRRRTTVPFPLGELCTVRNRSTLGALQPASERRKVGQRGCVRTQVRRRGG